MNSINITRRHMIAGTLGATVLTAGNRVLAQGVKKRTLKFGHLTTAQAHYGQGATKFSELVSEKSDGAITVQVFSDGQLGSEAQQIGATKAGLQDFFLNSSTSMASVAPQLTILDFPGLLRTKQIAYEFLDGKIGQELFAAPLKQGLRGIMFFENGFRQFTNNRGPIKQVDDFKGLKVRVIQNPIYIGMFERLGTHAITLSYTELYQALEAGVVDGQDNPIESAYSAKFQEVQRYLTMTNHVFNPGFVIMNNKLWEGMSDREREIIQAASREAAQYQRDLTTRLEREHLVEIEKKMEINYFDQTQTEKMIALMKPASEPYVKRVGEEFYERASEEAARLTKLRS